MHEDTLGYGKSVAPKLGVHSGEQLGGFPEQLVAGVEG